MDTAYINTQGDSQSVELPPGFRVGSEEVYVKRLGRSLLLIPKDADPWQIMREGIEQFTDDFMAVREQPSRNEREDLLD
ncbi:MAG: AbrB/MazE/SpoVT family DNA-binding domain-containing protein [Planctomycetota bacterium]|nr:AbrB/MazE/SpoVT family DNA-binding domain-containing protein [Planctomycetota bacterium]